MRRRPRARRPLSRMLTAGLLAVAGLFAGGGPGLADPGAAEIEAQISKAWAEAEPLIEQYNAVHDKYRKNLAHQADLARRLEPLARQLAMAQTRLGAVSALAYKSSSADTLALLLGSDGPADFADQLTYLDRVSRAQQHQIQGVLDLKARYDAQKAPVDALVAELARQDADLNARRGVIEQRLAQLQRMRQSVYAKTFTVGSYRPWPCPTDYLPTKGYAAAAFACLQAGKQYIWAAAGPGSYDCSGLTLAAWARAGVELPHNAAAQRASMPYVPLASARVGDLAFTNGLGHVAILVGKVGGRWVVMQAANPALDVRMTYLADAGSFDSIGRPG